MTAAETSIVLADDHPLVLRGLVDLFSTETDLRVIGTATDGRAALDLIIEKGPAIAVLDLVMPRLSGLEVLRELTHLGAPSRVVFLSALITDQQSIEAIGVGAWGILLKESAPEALVECLRCVRFGKRWLPGNLLDARVDTRAIGFPDRASPDADAPFLSEVLTTREREIVNLVARGLSNRHIGVLLGLTEGTIKIHLHNVYSKLDITNRTALAARVIRSGVD
ncbi:MAG: response regulator transcription factor [Rhizobium sp.]|nr:response regulator transcription factor [Rhizobium sp.]